MDELRGCYIKDNVHGTQEKALFHRWMESTASGENTLYAVVELENGAVKLTYSRNIRFADGLFKKTWGLIDGTAD